MIRPFALSTLAALSLGLSATPSFAGDADAGESQWRGCRSCHAITDDEGTVIQRGGRTGPNLYGISGRAVASEEGFGYSDALLQYAATGATWEEDNFVEYVSDPTAFLREHLDDNSIRSAMNFRLRSGADDLWAYLESLSDDD